MTDGKNMLCRDGKVLVRQGFTPFTALGDLPFSDPGLGGITYLDNALLRRTWAVSPTTIAELTSAGWVDRTGTALQGSPTTPVRMALFQTSTDSTVVMVNNIDRPRKLVSGTDSAEIGTVGCVCDTARDVTVAFQRVIFGNIIQDGIRAPSSILISSKDDVDTYPALNRVDFSDTNDTIVAVRALNTQAFAVYKDKSQWIGIGSPQVYPFVFELRSQTPGPVSPSAVVAARGVHYYVGQDGDVYQFNGSTTESVGAPIRRFLQRDLYFASMGQTHGYYNDTFNEIWWFYVSKNAPLPDYPDSAIVYNIDTKAFSPVLRYPTTFSASFDYDFVSDVSWEDLEDLTWDTIATLYPAWTSFSLGFQAVDVLLRPNGTIFRTSSDLILDHTDTIDAFFTQPLREYAGAGQLTRVDAVEIGWSQAEATRPVNVTLLTTDTLATAGHEQQVQSFDLAIDQRHMAEYHGTEARFIGVRQDLPYAHGGDEYKGMTLYLYPRSVT